MTEIVPVPASDLAKWWGPLDPLLDKVIPLTGGRLSKKTLADALLDRDMQLWIVAEGDRVDAFYVTQIKDYRTGLRVCDILLCAGGGLLNWAEEARDSLTEWAKQQGCHKIEFIGRKGWAKVHGMKPLYTFMERDL